MPRVSSGQVYPLCWGTQGTLGAEIPMSAQPFLGLVLLLLVGTSRAGEGTILFQPHRELGSPAGAVVLGVPALPLSLALHKPSEPCHNLPRLGKSLPGPTTAGLVPPSLSWNPKPSAVTLLNPEGNKTPRGTQPHTPSRAPLDFVPFRCCSAAPAGRVRS